MTQQRLNNVGGHESNDQHQQPPAVGGIDLGKVVPLPPSGKVFSLAEIEAGLKGLAMEQEESKRKSEGISGGGQIPTKPATVDQQREQQQHHSSLQQHDQ